MTPAKLQELAREAGLSVDGDSVRSPHLDCVALGDLARFAAIVRAAALEEAARALEVATAQKRLLYGLMNAEGPKGCAMAAIVRALAQQAGGEAP